MLFADPLWALLRRKHHPGSCCLQKHLQSQSSRGTGRCPGKQGQLPASIVVPARPLRAGQSRISSQHGLPPFVPRRCWLPPSWPRRRWTEPTPSPGGGSLRAAPPPPARHRVSSRPGHGGNGAGGAQVTFLYSCSVIFPSWSESYMWNRTGGDRRRGQGQGSPFPAPPNPPGSGTASHLSFSLRKRSSCSSSMFISMGLK